MEQTAVSTEGRAAPVVSGAAEASNSRIPPLSAKDHTHFRGPGAWWNPTPKEKRLLRSNIAKIVYVYWLNRFVNVYSPHPYQYQLLDRRETLERVRTNSMEGFRRNLDLLVTLAKSDGRGVLLIGPLQARRENLAKGRPELQGMEQILEEGIERHRAVIQEIARARQVQMVAPRIGQFRDEMFTDSAHLTPAGEKVKAGEVLPALKQLIEERGLDGKRLELLKEDALADD